MRPESKLAGETRFCDTSTKLDFPDIHRRGLSMSRFSSPGQANPSRLSRICPEKHTAVS